jgi:hypothetical protein
MIKILVQDEKVIGVIFEHDGPGDDPVVLRDVRDYTVKYVTGELRDKDIPY